MGSSYNVITGYYAHKCSICANVFSGYPVGKYSIGHFWTIITYVTVTNAAFIAMSILNWMGSSYNVTTGYYVHRCSIYANVVSGYPTGKYSIGHFFVQWSLDVRDTNAAFMLMSSVDLLQGNTVLDIFWTMIIGWYG